MPKVASYRFLPLCFFCPSWAPPSIAVCFDARYIRTSTIHECLTKIASRETRAVDIEISSNADDSTERWWCPCEVPTRPTLANEIKVRMCLQSLNETPILTTIDGRWDSPVQETLDDAETGHALGPGYYPGNHEWLKSGSTLLVHQDIHS